MKTDVFDCLMDTDRHFRLTLSSVAMPANNRCWPASNGPIYGAVNSPDLTNPKINRQQAAQSMMLPQLLAFLFHTCHSFWSMAGVIGIWGHVGIPACSFLTPCSITDTCGMSPIFGLPPLYDTWRWRIAERYDLIVRCFNKAMVHCICNELH